MSDTPSATAELKLPKDLAAEKGMVNVQIDGVWRQFPKGTRIIEACRSVGSIVPHYCYHPKLTAPGNCRMCLVQTGMPPRPAPGQEPQRDEHGYEPIGWMPRPVIACANTVAENMGIRTSGELVEKCREGVMEFLLINHPLDCPICDQAGECRLQEHSVGHGRGVSRFIDMKVKKPKNVDIGPRIRLDDERCIMCSRCIRFMDEVVGDPVLGFTQRGTHTTLTVHPGRLLDSNYSLNTADICPVGALTSNDFRFQMRVWFLKETPSIDVNCGTGTNITIWTRGNKIHRITPRQNDEVNSCWMPDSHRLNFHYIDGENRLSQPLAKNAAGLHEPTTWSAALASAASAIKSFAPDQIAVIRNAVRSGDIKALIVLGEDLVSDAGFSSDDLSNLGLLVQLHTLANPTASRAHFVLPTAAFAEKRGSMVNLSGRLQRLNRAVEPTGQCRDDWESIRDLICAITGDKHEIHHIEDVFKSIAESIPAFQNLTLSKIGHQGTQITETGHKIPLLENERARKAAGLVNG
jgi:NADH-quinone oxidoreductase subunit G